MFTMSEANAAAIKNASFDVIEREINNIDDAGGVTYAPDKKMLYHVCPNDGSESYMSIVNCTYKVIKNGPVLDVILNSIKKFFAPTLLEGMVVKTTLVGCGCSTLVEMRLPNIATTIETSSGFVTHLYYRNILKNTFDGKGSLRLYTGNIDAFCTNGMISGEYTVLAESHRSIFNVDSFENLLETTCENYMSVTDRVAAWAKRPVETPNVVDFFNTIIHGKDKEPSGRSNDLAGNLVSQYQVEASTRGSNLFSVVSAMTHYASHGEGLFAVRQPTQRNGNLYKGSSRVVPINAKLFTRQEQVRKWVDSDEFKYLEAA
jgi:hypothetical protein